MTTKRRLIACTLLCAALGQAPGGAAAQEAGAGLEDPEASGRQYVIDVGGGGIVSPAYPGADSLLLFPFPIVIVSRFYLPGFGQVADGTETVRGFSFFPSFGFNGERTASDSSDLTGTEDVDWALELGLGAAYRYDYLRGFVALRQGINGHTGQVADFGLDVITNPTDRLQLEFGPRATWASGDYMDTYFGVTAAEAAAPGSVLSAYDTDAGFKSVGVAARASYAWTEKTRLHLEAGWDRFIGDAADSPIVDRGDEDQFYIGAGITYRFSFDLFEE